MNLLWFCLWFIASIVFVLVPIGFLFCVSKAVIPLAGFLLVFVPGIWMGLIQHYFGEFINQFLESSTASSFWLLVSFAFDSIMTMLLFVVLDKIREGLEYRRWCKKMSTRIW